MTEPDTIGWSKPDDVGVSRERLARLGERLESDIAAGTLPGAVALVARRKRVVLFRAFGRRDPAAPDPMARDTIFRIYSMTKPIVSVAAMMLVEEGRLSPGDPLERYIPAFADVKVGLDRAPCRRPITIQDLLRHTSGLTYDWLDTGPVGQIHAEAGAGRRDRTNAEQADLLATLPLLHQPGESWDYGRSTDVLGRVIEVVTGEALGDHLSARLFQPLGMFETGFHVPETHQARLAEALATDPDSGEPVRLLDVRAEVAMQNGGGGLASTVSDYARFVHMLASGGSLDGQRFLSPATLAWMIADHLGPETAIGSDLLEPGYGFGLGFAVRRATGIARFPGSVGDYFWQGLGGTSFWVDPERDLYAILMVQAPGRREHYMRMMRQMVYGALTD